MNMNLKTLETIAQTRIEEFNEITGLKNGFIEFFEQHDWLERTFNRYDLESALEENGAYHLLALQSYLDFVFGTRDKIWSQDFEEAALNMMAAFIMSDQ